MRVDPDEFRTSSSRLFLEPGGAWLVMLRRINDVSEVHARRYDLSTSEWGSEVVLDGQGVNAASLVLHANAQGDALVAWQDQSVADEVSVRAVTYSSETSDWSEVTSLVTTDRAAFRGLQVAASPTVGGLVTWGEQALEPVLGSSGMPESGIVHTTFSARAFDGDAWSESSTVWESDGATPYWASIPLDGFDFKPAGSVVASADHVGAFFFWNGALRVVAAEKLSWNEPEELATAANEAAAIALADGAVQALWIEDGSVFGARSDARVTGWSAPTRLESITANAGRLALSPSAVGSATPAAATWVADRKVYAAKLDADGTWQAPAQLDKDAFFNLNPGGGQPAPSIATDASGRSVVVAGHFGFALAESRDAQAWAQVDVPADDGSWSDVQLAVSLEGAVLVSAILSGGYGGPEDGDDHLFLFVAR